MPVHRYCEFPLVYLESWSCLKASDVNKRGSQLMLGSTDYDLPVHFITPLSSLQTSPCKIVEIKNTWLSFLEI